MRLALLITVPLGALFTLFAWSLSRLSPDAIGMAIGLSLGVLAGLPSAVLVLLARRRDDEDDDWQPTIIDYPAPVEVTPYTHLFRRAVNLQPLLPREDINEVLRIYADQVKGLDRQQQIDLLRSAVDYIEAQEVHHD